jgi:hypothetical protein
MPRREKVPSEARVGARRNAATVAARPRMSAAVEIAAGRTKLVPRGSAAVQVLDRPTALSVSVIVQRHRGANWPPCPMIRTPPPRHLVPFADNEDLSRRARPQWHTACPNKEATPARTPFGIAAHAPVMPRNCRPRFRLGGASLSTVGSGGGEECSTPLMPIDVRRTNGRSAPEPAQHA